MTENTQKWLLTGLVVLVAGAFCLIASASKLTLPTPPAPPLKHYNIILIGEGEHAVVADGLTQLGPCSVFYLKGKPLVYVCAPHLIFPEVLQSTPSTPESSYTPDPLRAPAPEQSARN